MEPNQITANFSDFSPLLICPITRTIHIPVPLLNRTHCKVLLLASATKPTAWKYTILQQNNYIPQRYIDWTRTTKHDITLTFIFTVPCSLAFILRNQTKLLLNNPPRHEYLIHQERFHHCWWLCYRCAWYEIFRRLCHLHNPIGRRYNWGCPCFYPH